MSGLAIACPGQGAQHPQMFDFALQSDAARDWLAEYAAATGVDVVALATSGEDLFSNRNAQLLICGAAIATWTALQERLPQPELFIGYSVGELAAYGCAGAWKVKELGLLVPQRALLMDQVAPKNAGMLAIKGLGMAEIDGICKRYHLELAIINSEDHFVLGGVRDDIESALLAITTDGHWCKALDVAIPSHTSFMRSAVQPFHHLLKVTPAHALVAPVLAGINGLSESERTIADTLSAQIAEPVRWQDCMNTTLERGVTVVLELGPGRTLSRMFDELNVAVEARSVEDFRTLDGIVNWVETRLATT
ncbi:ACP S-malonyltransferase [Herminiimonas sp. NPDC097707]|uniref:ACP S-malonyltransferase n=1 Tax=Herminiimonas sp. NPDC097707 TaxID=3364007 RepID=UPI00383B80A9